MGRAVAVVVTYQPELDSLADLLSRLGGEAARAVIVDDGSGEAAEREIAALASRHGAELVCMRKNAGLAAAQNAGMRRARDLGAEFVVLFDQDSRPERGMVGKLLDAVAQLRAAGVPVGAVGPVYVDARSGEATVPVRRGLNSRAEGAVPSGVVETSFLISSGSCIPLAALDSAGPMDEGLFIEHVDTDWCFRARRKGLRLFAVTDARMVHTPGESIRLFGGGRSIRHNRPLRYYYLFRNSVLLHGRAYAPASWVWYDRLKLALLFFYYALLTPPRLRNAAMMLKGLCHGLRGREGPA